jgi:hypothetical protein
MPFQVKLMGHVIFQIRPVSLFLFETSRPIPQVVPSSFVLLTVTCFGEPSLISASERCDELTWLNRPGSARRT